MVSLFKHNTPRWLIFLVDLAMVLFSVLLAYLLRFNFSIPKSELDPLPLILLYMAFIRAVSFVIARSYAGIIRYTSTSDAMRVFFTLLAGSVVFGLTNGVTWLYDNFFFIPTSIIIIELLATAVGMVTFRMLVKIAYLEFQAPVRSKVNVIIYGAGEAGITAKRVLDRDAGTNYRVLSFLDDDPAKEGRKLEGVGIINPDKLSALLEENEVEQVILAAQQIRPERRQRVIDLCLSKNIKVRTVPPMIRWINGELSFNQIKNINIEDLLERPEIRLDIQRIREDLEGKVILVSGACGSIGNELVRQVANFGPKQLVLLDQAETPLHYLELEFNQSFPGIPAAFIVVDICNRERMERIFRHFKPELVYHAAAYKHVPMMENNPSEAVTNNINGTKIMADLSMETGCKKFIMISTDKAVNPTNVMGASKRIAEIYTQSLNRNGKTSFITTRFGNVLGSNGSVIPLFRNQIEKGGPLTVTHPEITRFFMTIPEACQLVIEAGAMGNGGEIFVFDMGKPVRILDLARKMIQLSGMSLEKDIQIKFIGLRPGEKLFEELLNKEENTVPTHHPMILIARVREYEQEVTDASIHELIGMTRTATNMEIVKKMKQLVPEFKSQNSIYEKLDS